MSEINKGVNRGMPKKKTKTAKKGSKAHRKKISDGLREYWKTVRKKTRNRRVRKGGNPSTKRARRTPGGIRAKSRRNVLEVVRKRKASANRNRKTRGSGAWLKIQEKKKRARIRARRQKRARNSTKRTGPS